MEEKIKEVLSDFNYHDINDCPTMTYGHPYPCGHTGCGSGSCKERKPRKCTCGGEERYEEHIKALSNALHRGIQSISYGADRT